MKIKREDIKKYIEYLHRTHHSENYIWSVRNVLNKLIGQSPEDVVKFFTPRSIRTAIAILNAFLRWLGIEPVKINLGRLPTSIPDFLNQKELEEIWKTVSENSDKFIRKRDIVIFKVLLYPLGLRASEIVNLKWKNLKENILYVAGKGNKIRRLPLSKKLLSYLNEYREILTNNKEEDYIIQSLDGMPITRFELYRIVRKYSPSHHPHSFRHTSISHWLKNGMDLRTAREFSGHSSVAILERYLHFIDSDRNSYIFDKLIGE